MTAVQTDEEVLDGWPCDHHRGVRRHQGPRCVDVCPVQCIYEFNPSTNQLFSEAEAGSGEIANTHTPAPDAIGIFGDSVLYVNLDECTSCTACYQPDVCPVGAIYADEHVPDGTPNAKYNKADTAKGHDHTFFMQHSRDVFAD